MAKEKGQDLATRQKVVNAGVFGKGTRGGRGGKGAKGNGKGNGKGISKWNGMGKGGSVLAGFAKRTKGARGAEAEKGEVDFKDELVSSGTDDDDKEEEEEEDTFEVKDDTMKVKVKVGVKGRMGKVRRLTESTVFTGVSTIYPIRRWKAHDGTLTGCLEAF